MIAISRPKGEKKLVTRQGELYRCLKRGNLLFDLHRPVETVSTVRRTQLRSDRFYKLPDQMCEKLSWPFFSIALNRATTDFST